MSRRFPAVLCVLFSVFGTASAALAQRADNPIPHMRPVHHGELEALAEVAGEGLFRVRSFTAPGYGFRADPIESDGIAVLLAVGVAEPALITTYAYLAEATSVDVWINEEWVPAEVVHGTPMFDLAALTIEAPLPIESALRLATAWPLGASVYVPLATNGSTAEPETVVGTLGEALPDVLSYYVRAYFWQRNGYPVLSADGEVIALTSRFVPDGEGVLAIAFGHVATWRSEWDRLDPDDPFGWRPEVRVETVDPAVNEEAFEIRKRVSEQ